MINLLPLFEVVNNVMCTILVYEVESWKFLRVEDLQRLLEVVMSHVGNEISLPIVQLGEFLDISETMSQHASSPDSINRQ
jgi:hypothetical protein